jgi:hypothetical protein
MEEPRDQQRQPSGPVVYPQQYAAPQAAYPYYPQAPAQPAGAGTRFFRMLRLILRRLLYGFVVVGRTLRPVAGAVLVGVLSLGVIGWLGWMLWGPKPGAPEFARADSIPPAQAVQTYLQGRKEFNADQMWDAFSTDYQAAQLNQGASKATLQSQANNEKLMGLQYGSAEYIGGVTMDDGGSMYFYTLDISVQSQKVKVPMIFTSDRDGKIESIMSPLNRLGSSE